MVPRAPGPAFLQLAGAAALLTGAAACASLPFGSVRRTAFWGFATPGDSRSMASVAAHSSRLRVLVSGWIVLDSASGDPIVLFRDTAPSPDGVERFALVTTVQGVGFHQAPVRLLGADPDRLARTAGAVASLGTGNGYRGLVLDFAGLTASDVPALARVVRAISDSAHSHGIAPVAVVIPAADTAAYPPVALDGSDLALVILYDQNRAGSAPGSLAAPEWVGRRLATRVSQIGAARIVAGLPLFGYRWRRAGSAEVVSYGEAARDALAAGRVLERDPASQTVHAVGPDGSETWVSDATLLDTLVRAVTGSGVAAVALWRLGLEDPAVWDRVVR